MTLMKFEDFELMSKSLLLAWWIFHKINRISNPEPQDYLNVIEEFNKGNGIIRELAGQKFVKSYD